MQTTSILLQDSLLLIWNNRDAAERLTLMHNIYAPGIQFFESNDAEPFTGYEPINNLIGKLQADWPADFTFTLQAPLKLNHNMQHASWALGAPNQQPAATGIDVALTEDGKITKLYLFLSA